VQSVLHRSPQATSSRAAPALVTGLSSASRRADSFSQALGIALSDLREGLRSQSAMLFESADEPDARYRCRAASPQALVEGSIPASGFLLGRLRSRASPLAFTPEEMDTVLRWAADHKPQYVPEIEFLKKIEMRLAVSLRTKEETTVLLVLGPSLDANGYSSADKDVLQIYAQQLALMIENARLTDRVLEQEKIRRDVLLAAEVQERLLPQKSIEAGPIAVAAFTLPARGIGGDCYDFLDLGDNGIGNCPGRRGGQGNRSRSDHVGNSNIFAHHCFWRTGLSARADQENKQLPVSIHGRRQLCHFLLRPGSFREAGASLRQRGP